MECRSTRNIYIVKFRTIEHTRKLASLTIIIIIIIMIIIIVFYAILPELYYYYCWYIFVISNIAAVCVTSVKPGSVQKGH